ncbi:cell wall-binding repeat-containing protein [Microbacterium sp. H1-D42]|uniref:cell wall-binding repeat-containing protein n=1 Tax=Microbacterium sp. H1-D42 TaxID=2925844 RepID=UPI001F52BD2B|nr:cell wall-binding repeat-containing protein [Microbacterium sp. H1-D42]UNK69738.1 cell wall-binding repeat-containing protein [Microbacterium sp. H1-D42]
MTLLAVVGLVLGTAVPATAISVPVAPAAAGVSGGPVKTSLAGFDAGNLISDAVFTNKTTMTEAQIQSFFTSKVKTCRGGSDKYGPIVCLKDFRINSVTMPADKYCKGYTGAKNESAARIIYRVSQACNINPQVLIVMLQKEQGLVTHTWPSAWRYDIALGQGCPDTAPCDPNFVGFFHQIYGAARQMQLYMEGRYFTWYAPGKTWNILYNPNKSCGTSPVRVANKATSALYYYTPYQPNAAALRAGYGTGDSCSAYGNRNFYNYFTDWFGPTKANVPGAPGRPTATAGDRQATVSWPAPGSNGGAAISSYTVTAQPGGRSVTTTGATKTVVTGLSNGTSYTFSVTAKNLAGTSKASAASAAVAPKSPAVTREGGVSRYETAVAVSKAGFPSAGVPVAYVASGQDFPDALSGAGAAGALGGPVLLTRSGGLPDVAKAELARLAPKRVVILGGTGVVSAAVEKQVRAVVPAVTRQGGASRYDTAVAVSKAGFPSAGVPVAYVASGQDFPDALSGAAAAGALGGPVLLTRSGGLPDVAKAELARLAPKRVVILGGTGVVSAAVEKQVRAVVPAVTRQGGASRYDTAVAVSKAGFPSAGVPVAYVANGRDFPDALSGAAAAGALGGPVLLTWPGAVPDAVTAELARLAPKRVVILGGTGVVSAAVEAQISAQLYE